MELQTKTKILFLVLALCFIFSIVLTEVIIAGSHDHDCTGKECPVCLVIHKVNKFFKQVSAVLFIIGCLVFFGRIPKSDKGPNAYLLSPVALKVRFNS